MKDEIITNRAKAESHHESMTDKMDAHLEKMEACLEKTEATDLEANPEEISSKRSMKR
jgi:hypothetical protein